MVNEDKPKYLYRRVYQTLKQEILDGAYSADNDFPSERLLKERFSLNHLTIRKALDILVEERYIIRERGKGSRVIHQGKGGSFSESRHQVDTVHVLVESLNEYYGKLVNELERELRRRGIRVLVSCHELDPGVERDICIESLKAPRTLILFFASNGVLPWYGEFESRENVILGSGVLNVNVPQILSNDISGSMTATEMLIRLGYSKIALVSSDYKYSGVLRKTGYRNALDAYSIPVDDSLVWNGSFSFEGGYSACRSIYERHPDCRAFFCSNDESAFGAIRFLWEQGLESGKDYSIIGYGNIPASEYFGLSTVNQNIQLIVSQFLNLMEEFSLKGAITRKKYMIRTNLIVRDSCIRSRVMTDIDLNSPLAVSP